MRRHRDPLATLNERVKLRANSLNAIAIGLVGFAILRPATEDVTLLSLTSGLWGSFGLALHMLATYILGSLKKEMPDDDL